jgi:hypothetical protein
MSLASLGWTGESPVVTWVVLDWERLASHELVSAGRRGLNTVRFRTILHYDRDLFDSGMPE